MMKGYKVFNPDFTCRGFQYEVGKTYEENVVPDVCEVGFHFCQKLVDCFGYYDFNPNNKVAEIEALGDIDESDNKCCTNKITIVQEITWQEVLEMVNTGKGDTGLRNSGNCNSGICNSGNYNSGDWNKTSFSAGVFCTEKPKLIMFNKPTEMTFEQWRCSDACRLLNRIDFRPTEFIWSKDMTDEEKAAHPEWETTERLTIWISLILRSRECSQDTENFRTLKKICCVDP